MKCAVVKHSYQFYLDEKNKQINKNYTNKCVLYFPSTFTVFAKSHHDASIKTFEF